jgi:hypothetical protein
MRKQSSKTMTTVFKPKPTLRVIDIAYEFA